MRRILSCIGLATVLLISTMNAIGAGKNADEAAIRQAVLNYANSAYEVRPELVEQSVHPHLQKVGYVLRGETNTYRELWMNYYELKELVASWNQEGRFDAKTARRDIKILDRLDKTAVARLDAEWGIDFFLLAKLDGTWKIVNVIWQTYPPEPTEPE
jgi:hypothetical protein